MEQSNQGIRAPAKRPYIPKKPTVFEEGQIVIGNVHWDYKEPQMFDYLVSGVGDAVEDFAEMFDTLQKLRLGVMQDIYQDKLQVLMDELAARKASSDIDGDEDPVHVMPSGRSIP